MDDSADNNAETTEKLLGGITGKGFMPGQCGNPGGRPKKRAITDIYEKMLDDPEFIGEIEESIRKMIRSGRMVGQLLLKEMAERTEGKVTQPVDADVTILTLAEKMQKARERAGD